MLRTVLRLLYMIPIIVIGIQHSDIVNSFATDTFKTTKNESILINKKWIRTHFLSFSD